ncbi:transmembrane and coiled-coil domain-containing protein 6 [Genypterus blacodes]|uniref:transmembrane and coiled-coil domain-containing protein 6 n=1 Tax=Genypterus blacodes TaxID=154954 RepID=UPI003F766CC6
MWRLSSVRHKAAASAGSQEELRLKRREQERVLRQARRERHLVSKRLLLSEDEERPDTETTMDTDSGDQEVVALFQELRRGGAVMEANLKALIRALRNPSAQLSFIKQENSVHLLVDLLTGSDAQFRLQAVRCLHELSHSQHPDVVLACLPSTAYLLTYLSGQSTKFIELCLYTLGNLCPDNDVIRENLLAQGIISALTNCIENQRHNLAVVEAAGFTLSQLLQADNAAQKIIPTVLTSRLPSLLLSFLTPDPQFGLAPAIECAWCLHYLACSDVDNGTLLAHGALSQCSSLLVSLGGALAEGKKEEGLELLVWPLLRCVGNLLCSPPVEELNPQLGDVCLLKASCAFMEAYLQSHPALARESAWLLNNLTAHSRVICSALLTLNLVPGLIQLLQFSEGINTMILMVLGNVAHKEKEFCDQLAQYGLLPALGATLKMADQEMVILSLEILFLLVAGNPLLAEEFVKLNGISQLEAIQYNGDGEMRQRATYLLEHHLSSHRTVDDVPCP